MHMNSGMIAVFIVALSFLPVGCSSDIVPDQDLSPGRVSVNDDGYVAEKPSDAASPDQQIDGGPIDNDGLMGDGDSGDVMIENEDLVVSGGSGEGPADIKISLAELAMHNSRSDCWIAFEGQVYDITTFLPNHPGSAAVIIPYCGTSSEFESAFNSQHGLSKVSKLKSEGIVMGMLNE